MGTAGSILSSHQHLHLTREGAAFVLEVLVMFDIKQDFFFFHEEGVAHFGWSETKPQ